MSKLEFTFEFYNDRSLLSNLPQGLYQSLKEKGLISHGSTYVHFCGLITYGGVTAVFLPRNSSVDVSTNKIDLARNLLKAIQRYKRSGDPSTETADQGNEIIGSDSITLIAELLKDFVNNGLYVRRTEEQTLNQGRIDWKRTISKKTAFLSGSSIFYPDVIGIRKQVDQSSVVTKIHARILIEICKKAGWIAFSNPNTAIYELSSIPLLSYSIESQIGQLIKELHISYSDRDIYLLKGLIQYLNRERGADYNDFVIGIRECHGFWENMLDSCLLYKESINHRMLAPLYKISGSYLLATSKGHRTDTILKHPAENKYVIVDAKYYGAHNINDSPRLQDIVKQFYYAKALNIIEDDVEEVTNIFIFPGKSGNIESIHMAKKDNNKKYFEDDCLDNDYPPIQCVYQDPIELIKHYSKGKNLKTLTHKLLDISDNG